MYFRLTFIKWIIAITVLSISFSQTISIQGLLRDPSGKTAGDGNYTLHFKMYYQASGGVSIWSEDHPSVPVKHGVYAVELGTITQFSGISFSEQYYIGVSIDDGAELTPRVKLTTSPTSMAVFGKDNIFPSSGNVGVGTKTPEALLHIENTGGEDLLIINNGSNSIEITSDGIMHIPNSINFSDGSILSTAQGNSAASVSSPGNADIVADNDANSSGDIQFRTGDATQMIIKNEGNVGIGTTDPSHTLNVVGGSKFEGNINSSGGIYVDKIYSYYSNNSLKFHTNDGNGYTEQMRLDINGRLGIGTTDPSHKLNVVGGSKFEGNINSTGGIYVDRIHSYYANNPLKFHTNDGNGYSEHMRIDVNGNVGIGTTTPTTPLSVVGRISSTGSTAGIQIDDGTSTSWGIVNDLDDHLSFWNDSYRMILTSSGYLGIGTNSPMAPLDIKSSGTIGFSGWSKTINLSDINGEMNNLATIQGPGYLFIGFHGINNKFYFGSNASNSYFGEVNSSGFTNLSDSRLKKNIEPLQNVIHKVKAINGITFDWDWDEPDKDNEGNIIRHLGVIAQDVEAQFPELVTTSPDGMLGVNYGGLSAVLIEAVKEQQEIIDAQAEEIEDLKTRLARIEEKLK